PDGGRRRRPGCEGTAPAARPAAPPSAAPPRASPDSITPPPAPGGSHPLPLPRHVVDEQVLAEAVGPRVEGPALVDACHALDEGAEARAVVQHEGVDRDAAAGDPFDLAQRLLRGPHADPAERERPFTVEPAAEEVRRRLAVGD